MDNEELPKGPIPKKQIQRILVVVCGAIGGVILLLFWSSPKVPASTQSQADASNNPRTAPASFSSVLQNIQSLNDQAQQFKKQTEDIQKQKELIALQAAEMQSRMNGAMPTPPNPVATQAPANYAVPPSGYGGPVSRRSAGGSVSMIVQDLRHPSVKDIAKDASGTSPDPDATEAILRHQQEAFPPVGNQAGDAEYQSLVQASRQADLTKSDADPKKPKDLLAADPNWETVVLPAGITVIESVLVNKLEGSHVGPVSCMVTTPVYKPNTHEVVLPAGAFITGQTETVSGLGQNRLVLKFHRFLVNNGKRIYSIPVNEEVPALDQEGAVGVGGRVNHHWLELYLNTGILGAIAGLSQAGNSTAGLGLNPAAEFRNGFTQSMAQSSMQTFQQYSNRLPTIELPPGTRVKLILMSDQVFPVYERTL